MAPSTRRGTCEVTIRAPQPVRSSCGRLLFVPGDKPENIPKEGILPWEGAVVPDQEENPPISLLDAFDKLEKAFRRDTHSNRKGMTVLRNLLVKYYQDTSRRLDEHANAIREHEEQIAELREAAGLPKKEPKDRL